MKELSINEKIGARIRYYRKSCGLTIVELANKLHISKSAVSKYERGEVSITVESIQDIANALNIDPMLLIDEGYLPSAFSLLRNNDYIGKTVERYYAYAIASHSKAYLSTQVILIGKTSACLYGEVENEYNYTNSKYYYTGEVVDTGSSKRLMMVNPLQRNDFIIIDISDTLGNNPIQYAFCASFSVGVNYPLALKWVLSKTPITDKKKLLNLLNMTHKDLRSYRDAGAFFVPVKDERLNKES